MRAKQFFGITVLDKDVNEVGKIEDVEIDTKTSKVTKIIISLNKGILSNDSVEVDFDTIETIGDYILLSTVISKDADDEVEEVTVEVEDE